MKDNENILTQADLEIELKKKLTRNIEYRMMSEIEAKPIDWLWPGQIAKGKVTMISGDPGLGKSQVTANFTATITTGSNWPLSNRYMPPGHVILLSAEDDPEDTIRPRLEAAGANLNKVCILETISHETTKNKRSFCISSDLEQLKNLILHLDDKVDMIIIDPITAYLGKTDSHKTADVRGVLAPLSQLAAEHNIAILCISHPNKNESQKAISRTTGSGAFIAAARAAFMVLRDPDNPEHRLFLPIKNNIGNDQTGFKYTIEPVELSSGIQTSKVTWLEEKITATADEILSMSAQENKSCLEEAQDFLCEILSEGPIPSNDIKREAEDAGMSWSTIKRAKSSLGNTIKATKQGLKEWSWKLNN